MSSDWAVVSVGEISKVVTKGTTPTTLGYGFQENGIRFVKVETLSEDGRFLEDKFAFISDEAHQALLRSQLQEDDILFTIAGTIGRTGIVSPRHLPANTNQAIAIVRPDKTKVEPRFLYYVLSNRAFTRNAHSKTVQSVQANFSLGELKQSRLKLPSTDEQRALLTVLGPLDDRITLLRETNATLEAIAQAIFKSWFVDFDPVRAKMEGRAPEGMDEATAALFPDGFEESELGLVPKGWSVYRLADITERITKGTTPTTFKRPFVEKGINFVKAESMSDDGSFLTDKFAYIDDETHALLKRSQLALGDVLISIAGTIGRTALVTEDVLPANTNQAVALVRPRQNIFPSGLILRFLNRGDSKQSMNERVVQAVQANLSLGTLSDMTLVIPPPETVRKLYQTILAPIDKAKNINTQRVRTLSSLRDTLLPRLISGQLRLPEAASQLEEALA